MRNQFENLEPQGFQDLTAALAMAEFGARLKPLGPGRDGGRDMVYEGGLDWTGRARGDVAAPLASTATTAAPLESDEHWNGYTVFQVKHHKPLASRPLDNARWLWGEVRSELEAWTKPTKPGRHRTPDHLVFVTNVPLTPDPEGGGWAAVEDSLNSYRTKLEDDSRDSLSGSERRAQLARLNRIKRLVILDGNHVDTLVTVHDGVRRACTALLTAGDAFAIIGELVGVVSGDDLTETLHRHARTALAGDRQITFDEAGAPGGALLPLDQIAVDLPIRTAESGDDTLMKYVLDRGERVLRPQVTLHRGPRHLVVTGPMGNGKTTMSRLLVQAYRASLMHNSNNLGESAAAAVAGTAERLRHMGRDGLPKHRRWPMRVDLAVFAEEEGQTEKRLLRHIADLISTRTTRTVSPAQLDTWMRRWPWFLVLDGLDEVNEPTTRQSIIRRVLELVDDADANNLDILVVVTTRPVGYTEEIAPTLFERVDLAPLPIEQALTYGRGVVRARLGADHEAVARVDRGLERAAAAENTRELMVTPLQVLILTIIIESAGPLPPDRFALFWGYYDTVSKRERSKPGSLKDILDAHLPQITILHERVGYELHRRAQLSDRATATMSSDELRDLIAAVLVDDGHDPDGADAELVEAIRRACLQRLVLIRAHNEGVGFDVRALQELMAGRHLTTGPDTEVESRLRALGAHPHWRVPWVFAAGRVFAETQPHRRDHVVRIIEQIDEGASWRLGRISPVGPGLALDIAVDGGARRHPRVRKPLLAHALNLFQLPAPKDVRATTRLLLRAAGTSPEARSDIAAALRGALGADPTAQATAAAVRELVPAAADEVSASDDVRMLASVKADRRSGRTDSPNPDAWWLEVLTRAQTEGAARTTAATQALAAVNGIHALRAAFASGAASIESWEAAALAADPSIRPELADVHFELEVRGPILLALNDPQAADILERLLAELPFQDPIAATRLRDWVLAVQVSVAWDDEHLAGL